MGTLGPHGSLPAGDSLAEDRSDYVRGSSVGERSNLGPQAYVSIKRACFLPPSIWGPTSL